MHQSKHQCTNITPVEGYLATCWNPQQTVYCYTHDLPTSLCSPWNSTEFTDKGYKLASWSDAGEKAVKVVPGDEISKAKLVL